jgi:hypothetical protein
MYTHGQIAGALFPSANAKSSLGCHMDERRDWRLPAPSRASFHIAAAGATYARWLGAASVKVSPTIGSKRSWIVPTTHFRMPSSTVTAVIRDGVPDADREQLVQFAGMFTVLRRSELLDLCVRFTTLVSAA